MARWLTGVTTALLYAILSVGTAAAADAAKGPSCGTHWTGWVNEANPAKNPCPKNCVRGERLKDRTFKQGGKTQYDVQYQCYFASSQAVTPTRPVEPDPSARTGPANAYPLIKGSPGVAGAARGAWLDHSDPYVSSVHNRPRPSAAWISQLNALVKVIRESPALADLRGFYPELSLSIDESAQPVHQAGLSITFWPPEAVTPVPGVSDPAKKYRVKNEYAEHGPGGLNAQINQPPLHQSGRAGDALLSEDWMQDDGGKFFPLPPAERTIAGFPVRGGYLFLTAPGKAPLFLPVSQERAHRAAIRAMQGQLRKLGETQDVVKQQLADYNSPEMKKMRRQLIEERAAREKDPKRAAAARAKAERDDQEQERQLRELAGRSVAANPATKAANEIISRLEGKLAAMSPAQRRAPAYMKNDPESVPFGRDIVAADVKGGIPLMEYNRNFFDPKLPPHAMQLIVMRVESYFDLQDRRMTPDKLPLSERVPLAIAEQTDWRKAAALLK